ncbi:MAG: single-stranded-DNA-specific exonuclease RecJ [Candidatus Paceibacterota bacterium]
MPYPEFLRVLLEKRGITDESEIEKFLNPDYDRDVLDPFLLKDMDRAVERILLAVEKKEKTVIYSDYDADGIPGAVVLHDLFIKIGYENFTNYIPHRHNEGFGLNHEAVKEFAKQKVDLIITIDCGIADTAEAEAIKKAGIDLIITDHHLPPEKLPKAFAIIDPKREDCDYPFKNLCGCGVIYKVVQAILLKKDFGLKKGAEKWFLDMVGIATLSDMVPLIGENRALATYGLKVLRKSPRIGLMKLLRLLKVDQNLITEDDIGFTISPRINAASRMGNPEDAFNLFSTQDEAQADIFARHLDKINSERKGVVAAMAKEIKKIIEKRLADGEEKKKVLVIGNPDWKPSLLGLVANSLKDDHGCPVFLWGRDGGNILKGSCRSDGSVDLVALMREVETGILGEFGGHSMSGGFAVIQEKVHLLEEKLNEAYKRLTKDGNFQAEIQNEDMKINLDQVSSENYRLIERMSPFGVGNPKPLFLFEKIKIENVKMFGKENNHLELIFQNSRGRNIKAIGFFMKTDTFGRELKNGDHIELLANFEKSTFRGFDELRLRIVDIVPFVI